MEKLQVLKKHLPDWEFLDELLLDSEALYELAQIVKLQDLWLKQKATSLYIDPLLVLLKVKLLSRQALSESFVKSWHLIAQLDQLSPKGLEKAFVYWRDLRPFSERFKDQFGTYGARPGVVDYQDLVDLGIFTQEQFDSKMNVVYDELALTSKGEWIDYREFIESSEVEKKITRAYILAFLISDGMALVKTDPLTGKISIMPLPRRATGEAKSVAISVTEGTWWRTPRRRRRPCWRGRSARPSRPCCSSEVATPASRGGTSRGTSEETTERSWKSSPATSGRSAWRSTK